VIVVQTLAQVLRFRMRGENRAHTFKQMAPLYRMISALLLSVCCAEQRLFAGVTNQFYNGDGTFTGAGA
jgi:hypothetical protein